MEKNRNEFRELVFATVLLTLLLITHL